MLAMAPPCSLVVVGGSGFVGGAVVALASSSSPLSSTWASVTSLSRSGTPSTHPSIGGAQPAQVQYQAVDALAEDGVARMAEAMRGADAVVISVGFAPLPFVPYETQIKMNGTTNVNALEAAALAGVKRAVLVNAAMAPPLAAVGIIPRGYYDGKIMAREAARKFVDADPTVRFASCILPGPVYGQRAIGGGVSLPLGVAMAPAEMLLRAVAPAESTLATLTPVSVRRVAEAALAAASGEGVGYHESAL